MHAEVNSQLALSGVDAFDAWLQLPGEWVEAPNIRRGGESGVKRIVGPNGQLLYRKQQVGHLPLITASFWASNGHARA
jgi:hypothetical protein